MGRFLPAILNIAKRILANYSVPEPKAPPICILERSVILSLCKFMCVSSRICVDNLDLIFGLVQSRIEFGVKANIIVTIADLFNRFPNILNERVKDMFMLLHDKETNVR